MEGCCLTAEGRMTQLAEEYFHEPALRQLASEFIVYKSTESGVFGTLASLHCQMHGGTADQAVYAAAAAELMMLALDIYDDLQDGDNDAVPWAQCPPPLALNSAIGFQALALEALRRGGEGCPARHTELAIQKLNEGVLRAVNGQHADLRSEWQTEEACLQMIADKSGALVAAVCMAGTALAAGERGCYEAIAAYGQAIGIAAQLRNDVDGLERWDKRNDLLHRKRTLPLLFIMEDQTEEAERLRAYYSHRIGLEEILTDKLGVMEYIRRCGCLEYAQVHRYIQKGVAEQIIAGLELEEHWKEALLEYT